MLRENIGEDQGLIGECKGLWQTKSHGRSVLLQGESDSTYLLAELSVGLATVPIWAGWTRMFILHRQVLTWAGQWRQVAEEEVHLCRAVAIGQHILFFYCLGGVVWGKQHGGILFLLAGGRPGTLGADRYCR